MSTTFEWSPYLPYIYYVLLAVAAGAALIFVLVRRMWDFAWRAIFFGALLFLLLNPIILNEIRQGLPDKLVIVVDESASQRMGGRDKVTQQALDNLLGKLKDFNNIDPVIIHSGSDIEASKGESTNLFTALRNSMLSIPQAQVAGTVFITDGQVHDVPAELGAMERLGPFHAILTGRKDEFDRKVTVVSAPKYGVLNENVTISVKVEESGGHDSGPMTMSVYQDGQKQQDVTVTVGEPQEFTFKVAHPGQNVYEFAVPVADGELTAANNRAPVIVNGIRDRLRVLLVSGSPHMGERAWRNLLKSDPSVDLIHFTILRSPDTLDMTPTYQLSLIVFPVDELFQQKINDFDLIIFDRFDHYQAFGELMLPMYFRNIAEYVKHGGAFLMALGTGEPETGQTSALDEILPVDLTGSLSGGQTSILRVPYVPELTELGKRHPATADLQKQYQQKNWGSWFTQVDAPKVRGDTLMTGADGKPLLVLDKVGQGRVAVLSSDNVWLWSKGLEQSGPYTELLRNVAHWLMKEPELEDDFIKADAKGTVITVSERDLAQNSKEVVMTTPAGEQQTITLDKHVPGWITADVNANTSGIYSFDNGHKKAFAVVGSASSEEFADVRTTADKLKPVVEKTKGGIIWFQENQGFSLKEVSDSAHVMGSDSWLGIKRNKAYTVDNVETLSLVPNWLSLLIIMSLCVWAWWRESGRS